MSTMTQATRQLNIFTPLGDDVLLLTGFQGREELSHLFSYDMELISEDDCIDPRDIVGHNVSFSVQLGETGEPRFFNGFVNRFAAGGTDREGWREYRAEVVPWLWFLTRTSDCRIFQHLEVPQIIEKVFEDFEISDYALEISGDHPVWEYCVQYRETDFNFVSRLMEKEGIFYYFRHERDKHTLVLSDLANYRFCPEREVRYWEGSLVPNHISSWERQYGYRSGSWSHTDYNFKKPANGEATPSKILLASEKTVSKFTRVDNYELYDYPGKYEENPDGKTEAKIRMEAEEVPLDTATGASTCVTFTPGEKFTLRAHSSKSEDGKTYVFTAVEHSANEPAHYSTGSVHVGEYYQNQFTCIPECVRFRPLRTTAKPMIHGSQTAVVTGPYNEEIWPDEFGRIKVQFFWDREGVRDEKTSCWVRCMQTSAGKQWGSMFIPRIGQEVVITFLEGDPDRPLVTGVVYNAEQMPAYDLPSEKTKSYIKTNTSPGGEGFNEIRFEDKKESEQIFVHAQRNMDLRVLNDSFERVISDRHLVVGDEGDEGKDGDQCEMVFRDKHLTVHRNHFEHIGGDMQIRIGDIDGDGNQDIIVRGSKKELIEAQRHLQVRKDRMESIGGSQSLSVGGSRAEAIGGDDHLEVKGELQEKVGSDRKLSVGGSNSQTVGGAHAVSAGEVHIKGGTKVIIEAGSQLSLVGPGGFIDIHGGFIDIHGGGVDIVGGMVRINSGGGPGSGAGAAAASPEAPAAPEDPVEASPTPPFEADDARSGTKSAPDSLN